MISDPMNIIWLWERSEPKSRKIFLLVKECPRSDWSRSAMARKRQPALSRARNAALKTAAPGLSFLQSYPPPTPTSADGDHSRRRNQAGDSQFHHIILSAIPTERTAAPASRNPEMNVGATGRSPLLVPNRGDNRDGRRLFGRPVSRYQAKNDRGDDRENSDVVRIVELKGPTGQHFGV